MGCPVVFPDPQAKESATGKRYPGGMAGNSRIKQRVTFKTKRKTDRTA
nr:MAG TPA: hypothetical protein [Caudoviricetes sp.]